MRTLWAWLAWLWSGWWLVAATDLQFNLLEEVPPNTFISNVILDAQLDLKYSPNDLRLLHFSLRDRQGAQRNYKDYFYIAERDGILRTSRRMDREEICAHQLSCPIELNVMVKPGQFFEIIKVTINVLDLNDNAPRFPQTLMDRAIPETTRPGAAFSIPSAEDPDSGTFGIQRYQLVTDTNKFELQVANNSVGVVDLQLLLVEPIDREEEESFLMEIVAMDGGSPAKTGSMMVQIAVLDANDNNPRFDNFSYEVMISENTPIGSTILQVHAYDPDQGPNGEITYSFAPTTDSEYTNLFGIEGTTGEIFIKGGIDFESENVFQLTVMAQDKGINSLPAYAKLTIRLQDMNDHAPHITVNALTSTGYVEVSETAQVGYFVAHVSVADYDSGTSGEFNCHMPSDHFQLQKLFPTEFKIVTTTTFDREFQSEYHLNMMCEDNGEPARSATEHIVVTILDANDHPPEFQHRIYNAQVRENNLLGLFITQVVALDNDMGKNAIIRYGIADDDRGLLTINENTGIIRANVKFDYESDHELEFVVEARDQGSPTRTARALLRLVVLDSNDEVPQFVQSSYSFHVLENVHPKTFVGSVSATDRDLPPYNQITYSLHPDYDGLRVFTMNPYSGELSTREILDREEQYMYHLVAIASNDGYTMMRSLANVTVYIDDQNDNAPILDYPNEWNNTVHIAKSTPPGSVVARIRAHDIDAGTNAQLTYSIFDGNGEQYFFINTTTGVMYLSKKLDSDGYQFHKMKVVVQDGGQPHKQAMGDLSVVVNKSITIFGYQSSSFSFMNLKDGHVIVGAVVLLFIILLLVLVVVIVKCRRKQTARNTKYNCRREAKKRDTKKKDHRDSLEWKAVPNDYSGPDTYVTREVNCREVNGKEKPKKAVTFRVEVLEGEGDQLWPTESAAHMQKNAQCRESDTNSCDEDAFNSVERETYSGGVRRFPQPEPTDHYPNHMGHSRNHNQNHNFPTLTKAELEMHEMLQLLHQDGDSETGSYTDSGRGPSEEGDNNIHTTVLDQHTGEDQKNSAAGGAVGEVAVPELAAVGASGAAGAWPHRYPCSSRPTGAPLRSFMPSSSSSQKGNAKAPSAGGLQPAKVGGVSPTRHTLPKHSATSPRKPSNQADDQEPLWVPRTPNNTHSMMREKRPPGDKRTSVHRAQVQPHPSNHSQSLGSLSSSGKRQMNPCQSGKANSRDYNLLGVHFADEEPLEAPSDGVSTTSGSYMVDTDDTAPRDVTV